MISESVDDIFKSIDIVQDRHVKTFDGGNDVFDFDEGHFFFTILDNGVLGRIDILFNDRNSGGERSVIGYETLIQMNQIIVQFQ